MANKFVTREGLSCVELWFGETLSPTSSDVILHIQAPQPVPLARNKPFETRLIDLRSSPIELLQTFKSSTRRKIKQAERHKDISYDFIPHPTPAEVGEFVEFFNEFAKIKEIWGIWVPRIESYMRSGSLLLTRVRKGDKTLIWHAGLCLERRYVMLHSASHFRTADPELRNLIGKANRRLHYEEMIWLMSRGVDIYDFGGWYSGSTDQGLLMINRFKAEFGGRTVVEYKAYIDISMRAKLTRVAKGIARLMPQKLILSIVDRHRSMEA